LAVVVVVGALATGGVAAATGHLPAPVREAARSVLGPGHGQPAGSSSPAPGAPGTGTAGSGGGPGGSAAAMGPGPRQGPAVAGPAAGSALNGLCQAVQEGNGGEQGGKLDATAFQALAAAAGGADEISAFCEDLLATDAKAKKPNEPKPKDPSGNGGQGQGGTPPTTGTGGGGNGGSGGGGTGGGGGQGAGSPPPAASSPGRG
jgi:hypothetical protein